MNIKQEKKSLFFKYVVVCEMMVLCLRMNFYQNELKQNVLCVLARKKNIDVLMI
jgi:hypothetical protein